MPSSLLTSTEAELEVTYSSFSLLTRGGGDQDPLLLAPLDGVASFAGNGLGLFSAANNHTANVRVECWDGPPPEPTPGPDELVVDGRAGLDGGPLTLLGVDTGYAEDLVEPPLTGDVRARVRCAGRAEAARREADGDLFFHGVERWTIQFWPDLRA